MKNLIDVDENKYMVVDLETGMQLNTCLVLVPLPEDKEMLDHLDVMDGYADDYINLTQIPLFVDLNDE